MDDQVRRDELIRQIQRLDGISQELLDRLKVELDQPHNNFGYDEQDRFKIAFFDAKSYDRESFVAHNQDQRFAFHFIKPSLNENTLHAASGHKAICIFVNDRCDAQVVAGLAALGVELIALRCAGYNNVDLEACRAHGISVVRVPAYSPHAVAEHTVALMLMLNRHLHLAYMRNRAGSFVLEGLTGFDMRGKTVGVIGTGKIGVCVIDILLGFGCRVLAFDKFPNAEVEANPRVDYVSMEQLLEEADMVTLHVPLFDETYHLINDKAIARMKSGVMLINTSRGGLVDTRALIDGLKSGKIGSAGLDVYEEEAGIFFHDMSGTVLTDDVLARLMTFNNVVITSHQAFLTNEALSNIAETTLLNVSEFLDGRRGDALTNSVSPS